MSNNIFYKALAAVSTVGIVVIAGIQVTTALKKGNNAEDQLAKTMVEIKNARKDALAEVKAIRSEVLKELDSVRSNALNEIKTDRANALNEVNSTKTKALKSITQAGGEKESVWLLLRFGAVERGGGFIEKIPMADTSQCELQGAIFTGSKRLWPAGDARGFECLESN